MSVPHLGNRGLTPLLPTNLRSAALCFQPESGQEMAKCILTSLPEGIGREAISEPIQSSYRQRSTGQAIAEVSTTLCIGGYCGEEWLALTETRSLVVTKNERLVLLDWPSQKRAELIAL